MFALLVAAAVLIVAGVALLLLDARRRSALSRNDNLGVPAADAPALAGDAVAEKPEFVEPEAERAEPELAESELTETKLPEPDVEAEPVEAEDDAHTAAAWADEDPVDLPDQLVLPADEEAFDEALESATADEVEEEAVDEATVDESYDAEPVDEVEDFADEVEYDEDHDEADDLEDEDFEAELEDEEDTEEDEADAGAATAAATAVAAAAATTAAVPAANPHVQSPRSNNPFASLLNLGGSLRRQRREWANANSFDFTKEDRFLSEEWARGAAASGHSTRDVVSGAVGGREIHVADLGETTVLAMRRGAASNVVMVAQRPDSPLSDDDADDLYEVGDAQGFIVYANDEEAIHRMFDERTDRALEGLPPEVTAVWAEGDWVLAQLVERTTPEAWEATFPSLAQLADCLRMLPPRAGVTTHFDDQLRDPSRPRPFTIQDDEQSDPNHRGHLRAVPAVPDAVISMEEEPVWRPAQPPYMAPTEPVELPSRSRGTSHGDVQDMPNLGGSPTDSSLTPGLPALGTDPEHSRASNTGGRIIRRMSTASTIFDDATPAEEPGTATPATPTEPQKESSDDPAADEH